MNQQKKHILLCGRDDREITVGIGGMMGMIKRDKFCRQCGKPVGNTGRFCGDCGAEIVVTSSAFASLAADQLIKPQMEPQKNPPSDKGLKMLIDCCRKVIATAVGDGHNETVLYLDESTGQYQIHTYFKDPGCPEFHRAYLSDESVYRKVLEKIRENKLIDLMGGNFNGMCGGEYVVKFVIDDIVSRVSTANVPYQEAGKLYEVGAVLEKCIDREKEITGDQ